LIGILQCAAADVPTPASGKVNIFLDSSSSLLSYKDSVGTVHLVPGPTGSVALGDTLYGSAANVIARLAGNTTATKKFLNQTGNGSASAAPSWAPIVENDVGASTSDAGNTSTAITLDWSTARTIKVTATGNATVTHSNMVAGIVYTLEYHTGAGSFTASFSSTNWAGSAPTLTTTASKLDVFTFYKTIGGTILGAVYGQSFTP
jgi:hypothetical protein